MHTPIRIHLHVSHTPILLHIHSTLASQPDPWAPTLAVAQDANSIDHDHRQYAFRTDFRVPCLACVVCYFLAVCVFWRRAPHGARTIALEWDDVLWAALVASPRRLALSTRSLVPRTDRCTRILVIYCARLMQDEPERHASTPTGSQPASLLGSDDGLLDRRARGPCDAAARERVRTAAL